MSSIARTRNSFAALMGMHSDVITRSATSFSESLRVMGLAKRVIAKLIKNTRDELSEYSKEADYLPEYIPKKNNKRDVNIENAPLETNLMQLASQTEDLLTLVKQLRSDYLELAEEHHALLSSLDPTSDAMERIIHGSPTALEPEDEDASEPISGQGENLGKSFSKPKSPSRRGSDSAGPSGSSRIVEYEGI
jgi:hypothetical protein